MSAGILAYRRGAGELEVLLVHPGGPFWRNRDHGAWSIPKGEVEDGSDPEQTARREFAEELGPDASIGALQELGEVRQRGGKRVIAFAAEGRFDPAALVSNPFHIEWPPRSGRLQSFPEVDRAEWFAISFARSKILHAQAEFFDRLLAAVGLEQAGAGMLKIGIISDTHGLLRPEAERRLVGVDHIVHAGDIGRPEIIAQLRKIAPVTAIKGNIDSGEWARNYADTAFLRLGGKSIYVLHDLKTLALDPNGHIDVVVSGHSHAPKIATIGGILYLNPGSAGRRRFSLPITLATLVIAPQGLVPEIHVLKPTCGR